MPRTRRILAAALVALVVSGSIAPAASTGAPPLPDILIVTVDTLRADHLSIYGDPRPITPNLDRLLARGMRFKQARTLEPLTSPSMVSLFTSLHPHEHGSTRNGLRMRPGLASLSGELARAGYVRAAFVSNWTLRRKLCGLGDHFDQYQEVLTEKRWFGMVRSESAAPDVTRHALAWLDGHRAAGGREPVLLWVHYSDPHAPYDFHPEHAEALGIDGGRKPGPRDRYATEVAFTDAAIGVLLDELGRRGLRDNLLVVFAADHGESLGEHDYWGHGANLLDKGLRIPMGIAWPGRVPAMAVSQPALISDIAPTVLGLLGRPSPRSFKGYDWSQVARGAPAPASRVTFHQVHRGAVMKRHRSEQARRSGLLEVAAVHRGRKEILSLAGGVLAFDLRADPSELSPDAEWTGPSKGLQAWLRTIQTALDAQVQTAGEELDEEDLERLKALGYVD
ncbi:MAG TPA: sulfatase [Candidatus Polarisedimenticolia bacterium]|nr:sulfatase [Candidatus Polarisedimenticolia bacterium]